MYICRERDMLRLIDIGMDMDIWIERSLTLSNQTVLDAEKKREAEGGR